MRTLTRSLATAMAGGALAASTLAAIPATAADVPWTECNGRKITKVVESGTYSGTSGNDVVVVTGKATITLGKGDDLLCVLTNSPILVEFGDGRDTLLARGSSSAIYAWGGAGDDYLQGGDGVNYIFGDAGNDQIFGANRDDVLYGGAGDDQILAANGDDLIKGGDGNDVIEASGGNDHVDAGSGDDAVKGGDGDDHIVGGLGTDKLYGDKGDDSIWGDTVENEGEDLSWVDTATAARGLTSGYGNDRLFGGAGNDKLVGDRGDDYLDGGRGDDYLEGGPGSDQLWSGSDVEKSAGTWEQVTGDTLIGDYYETRTNGGFASDHDILGSSHGGYTATERPGIVKHAYGGRGNDIIAVLGISSLTRSSGGETIKRTAPSKVHGGPGNDQITALHMEKVEATSGDDTIKAINVLEIHGGTGKDYIKPLTWGQAYGGSGDDTFDLCQSPTSKHGYTWGDGEKDKWVGGSTIFKGLDPKDTPIISGFKNYQNSKASTLPAKYTYSQETSAACPKGHQPDKVKLKTVTAFFDEFEEWVIAYTKNSSTPGGAPEPWK